MRTAVLCVAALALPACSSFLPTKLPSERPPLSDMEEPLAFVQEPKDEAARAALPLGGFTGIYVADARQTLDELEGDAAGVRVARVVENSPGDAAGLVAGDLILAARPGAVDERDIRWPSEWRALGLSTVTSVMPCS